MDFMSGNLFKIIFHRFVDLPLPVFRGSKGRISMNLSLQQLRRPLHIHTPLVSANAVIMWCMECVWISYRMRLLDKASVCMGGEGFLHLLLYCTCTSPFLSPFVFYACFRLFFLDSIAVYTQQSSWRGAVVILQLRRC
jgi:hypothetical protein